MKNFLLLLFGILLPGLIWGQVKVANATKGIIQVEGISIPSRVVKDVNLAVKNEVVAMEVFYYEGLEKRGPVKIFRQVEKGQVIIRDFSPNSDLADKFNQAKTESAITTDFYLGRTVFAGDWWSEVTVTPENKLQDYSIFVPADPFRGLALKPNQKSEKSVTLKTGEIIFPVFLAAENDATKTGVSFSWALVNKIVTEGQTAFEFLPEDIMKANSGEVIKKTLVSKLPFDFIISEGASRGTVIPANYPQKLELYLGWNIIPIQYKDNKGLPTQAILILLVNDLRRSLLARSRGGADQVSVSRDNIVVTNYSR
jgi:hypothetical protein